MTEPATATFDAFMTGETELRKPASSGPDPLRQLVAAQLVKAKLVPASRSNQLTDAADAVRFLSDQVLDIHRAILKDGSANLNERRLSYQAVCLHFLMMLTMTGGIEPPQE